MNGTDVDPAGCDALDPDKPGLMWHHADSVDIRDSAQAIGNPQVAIDTTLNAMNIFQWGDFHLR